VATPPEKRPVLEETARGLNVPFAFVGRVTADERLRLGPIDLTLEEMRAAYEGGLPRALEAPLVA
jgi:hypothetical protein